MMTPTKRQQQALDIIKARIASDGIAPTLREIATAMGMDRRTSVSNIQQILLRLEERGLIRRRSAQARAIEVVDPFDARLKALVIATLPEIRKAAPAVAGLFDELLAEARERD